MSQPLKALAGFLSGMISHRHGDQATLGEYCHRQCHSVRPILPGLL